MVFSKVGTRRFQIDANRREIPTTDRKPTPFVIALSASIAAVAQPSMSLTFATRIATPQCFQVNLRGTFKEKTSLTKSESYPTRRRAYIADTIALIVFFTTTGVINERLVAGMTWEQVVQARVVGAFLMVPTGRPYGLWRDWMMSHAAENGVSRLIWDSLALLSSQVPIYAAIIIFSGATGDGLVRGVIGAAILMLSLGRPYGAFLNLVRRLFGLPRGGSKPMSLNT